MTDEKWKQGDRAMVEVEVVHGERDDGSVTVQALNYDHFITMPGEMLRRLPVSEEHGGPLGPVRVEHAGHPAKESEGAR